MKMFKAVLLVKTDKGFLAVKQDTPEIWLTPEDEFKYLEFYNVDYSIRDMLEGDNNATE